MKHINHTNPSIDMMSSKDICFFDHPVSNEEAKTLAEQLNSNKVKKVDINTVNSTGCLMVAYDRLFKRSHILVIPDAPSLLNLLKDNSKAQLELETYETWSYADALQHDNLRDSLPVLSYYKGENYLVPIFIHTRTVSGDEAEIELDVLDYTSIVELYNAIVSKAEASLVTKDITSNPGLRYFPVIIHTPHGNVLFIYRYFKGGYNGANAFRDTIKPLLLYLGKYFDVTDDVDSAFIEKRIVDQDKNEEYGDGKDLLKGPSCF
jgi:hypothetical protein